MIKIPYGKTFFEFDDTGANVLVSGIGEMKPEKPGIELVREAMESPIESPRLSELAKGKKTCTVIISDHTRPVPSKDILPNMLRELREGNPEIDITLLVSTGCHRATSPKELEAKLGSEIYGREKIVVHDAQKKESNVFLGTLPSETPCYVDEMAVNTDLLVAEGFIEPHFFAGFSGGRKSVLPGVCDAVTVYSNHCSKFIDSEYARTGNLEGNPIHRDMVAAAEMAKLQYIVNVVIDENKQTVAAFAGDFKKAHEKGCEFLLGHCQVKPKFADIVITSNGGAPLDQNLYQCVKGMTAAEATCSEGGVIIICAECADGHGGEAFCTDLRDCESPAELYARQMQVKPADTKADQWQSQILARVLMKFTVIVVTRPEMRETVEGMKMLYAADLDSAVGMAKNMGKTTVTVIPDGVSVIIK